MRSHLELEAEEQRANCLTSEDAAIAARREFGDPKRVAEDIREVWRRRWLERIVQDLRFAGQLLARNWGLTAGAVVPLGFAIGCTACVLTLVDAVLFRPLGLKDPNRDFRRRLCLLTPEGDVPFEFVSGFPRFGIAWEPGRIGGGGVRAHAG